MKMNKTDLSKYDNSWYSPGAGLVKRALWYFVNSWFFKSSWCLNVGVKVWLLRLFGAEVGKGVNIKPNLNIKYPWNLKLGDYCWIGENVWIDNLDRVTIGSNAVVSQGVMLLCGNHDFSKQTFDLMTGPITIEDGAWVGAQCTVCPGVRMCSHSVLTVGSVATKDCEAYGVYQGNPAVKVKTRVIK